MLGLRPEILALPVTPIRLIAEWARTIDGVTPMWFGESDEDTPEVIVEAAVQALRDGLTRYQPNQGYPPLVDALQTYLTERYAPVARDRLTVTASGMNALMLCAQAVVRPGGKVVVIEPQWPNIAAVARLVGAAVSTVDLRVQAGRWRIDLDELLGAINADTDAVIVNSPSNPTGWTATREELAALVGHCRRTKTWVISDEVYNRIFYGPGGRAPSVLDVSGEDDQVMAVGSFSKAWTMTGWRLGWIVAPARYGVEFRKLNEYNLAGPTSFAQAGAVAALKNDWIVDDLLRHCTANRNRVLEALGQVPGLSVPAIDGAFYSFFRVEGVADSFAFAREAVLEGGVGLAPGIAFGASGEGWMRLCFAVRPETLEAGLSKLSDFMAARHGTRLCTVGTGATR